jgi:hypothetical protein
MELFEIFFLVVILVSTALLAYFFIYKNDIKPVDTEHSVQREMMNRQNNPNHKSPKIYASMTDTQLEVLLETLHKIATKKQYREPLDHEETIMYKRYYRSVHNEMRIIKETLKKAAKKQSGNVV